MTPVQYRHYQSALLVCLLLVFCAACNHSGSSSANSTSANSSAPASSSAMQASSAIKHYAFKGKIVSVDMKSNNANIDGEDIPGFMGAMTMVYDIRPASDLQKLHAGDSISGDLVVDNSGDVEKYWLEKVVVAPAASPKP